MELFDKLEQLKKIETMREIKFRAFFYDGSNYETGEMFTGREAWNENYIEWDDKNKLSPTDKCTILMQYTGLKDKNGVEIYEGDVLALWEYETKFPARKYNDDSNCIVEWSVKFGGWYDIRHDHRINIYPSDRYEIIGNIYQNPELLCQPTKN